MEVDTNVDITAARSLKAEVKLKRKKEEPDPGRADRAEEEVELDGPDMCEDYDDVGSHGKSDQESEEDGDGEKAVDKQEEPSGVVTSAATASASGKSGRSGGGGGDDSSDDSDDDHDAGGRPSGQPGRGAAQQESEKSIEHRKANHSWGSFRITIRPPTGGPRSHGSWFARCPYHRTGKTWCNRTSTIWGPSEQDSKIALCILYEWCNRARDWTRKRDHMAWPLCDPNDLPGDEILHAQLPRPLDPDE